MESTKVGGNSVKYTVKVFINFVEILTLGIGNTTKNLVLVPLSVLLARFSMVNGRMISPVRSFIFFSPFSLSRFSFPFFIPFPPLPPFQLHLPPILLPLPSFFPISFSFSLLLLFSHISFPSPSHSVCFLLFLSPSPILLTPLCLLLYLFLPPHCPFSHLISLSLLSPFLHSLLPPSPIPTRHFWLFTFLL